MRLLALAFYLSVLSYCTGLLLKALPLPFLSIKRIARELVSDGLFSAVLVFSYDILLSLVNYISSILGSDWAAFSTWLANRLTTLTNVLVVLKAIGVALERVGLGFIASNFVSPVTSLIVSCFMTLLSIFVLAAILLSSYQVLIALGLVLHAIPLKLARSAGATIIAVTMVFLIGIPLMPSFSALLVSNVQPPFSYREPVCSASFTFVDAVGNPAGYVIVEGYDPSSGELLYRYLSDHNGYLDARSNAFGFPCRSHTMFISIAGLSYVTQIADKGSYINETAVLPDVIVLAPNRLVKFGADIQVAGSEKSEGATHIYLNSTADSEVRVVVESGDSFKVYLNSVEQYYLEEQQLDWYGAALKVYVYRIPRGTHNLTVVLGFYKTSKPNVQVEPFIAKVVYVDVYSPEALIIYAIYSFVELAILPVVYVVVLASISAGVARILGGFSSALARFAVGYL